MRRALIVGSSPEVRAYRPWLYHRAENIVLINYAWLNISTLFVDPEKTSVFRIAADNDPALAEAWEGRPRDTNAVMDVINYIDIASWKQNYTFKRWDDTNRTPDDLPTYITSLVPAVYFAGHHLGADEIILVGCPFIKHAGTTRREGPAEGDTEWEDLAEQVGKVLKQMPVVPKTTTLNSPLDLEYFPLHKLLEASHDKTTS